jgi:DNA-directed RNA polymerase specialized sigma24 family protein
VPDLEGRSPEEAAEESDLVGLVLERAGSWPAFDREVFVLHFIEGFSAREIARLEQVDEKRIEEALAGAQQRLRALLRDEPYLR